VVAAVQQRSLVLLFHALDGGPANGYDAPVCSLAFSPICMFGKRFDALDHLFACSQQRARFREDLGIFLERGQIFPRQMFEYPLLAGSYFDCFHALSMHNVQG
jgi:hypothetical protein